MIPYGKQYIDNDDIKTVVKILKSDFITCGTKVGEFENKFAKFVGAKYAVAVSSGTAALHLSCLVAGLNKGDELITSPLTFCASANCALYCRAKPVFADINEQGLIDENLIEEKITKKTKIIIPVHYAGFPCNLARIKKIADKYNLIIIEDACHALGAKYKKSKIGDCRYSDMVVFSFHPVKHITTGEGGMITTNNKGYYEKLLMLRNHGITKESLRVKGLKFTGSWYHEMQVLGFNYRLTDIQCALGMSQLKKVNKFIKRRRSIAKIYDQDFANHNEIKIIKETKDQFCSYHLYPIRVKDAKTRLNLFNYLKSKNIYCQVHYIPVYWHPYYQKFGYKKGLCPKAESFYQQEISIPLYFSIKQKEVKFIIAKIFEFCQLSKKWGMSKKKVARFFGPIKKEHIFLIMKWRNEQINILRHKKMIKRKEQINWFNNLKKDKTQKLFAIFSKIGAKEELIGYGGLTHIDNKKRQAEVSFLIDTNRTKNVCLYKIDMLKTLSFLTKLGFLKLKLKKLFTETYKFRKTNIRILEGFGFKRDEVLRSHLLLKSKYNDSLVHSLKKKKILFIGAGPAQIKGIKRAKEMGLLVIATDGDSKAPGLKIADIAHIVDVKDIQANLKIARKYNIDGVLGVAAEVSVRTVAAISERLGLPGISMIVAEKCTDKELMRKAFLKAGVPSPKSFRIFNFKELVKKANEIGFPVVTKPANNAGSRGVKLVKNRKELNQAYQEALKYAKNNKVLIEDFMEGVELSVEAFVVKGKVKIIALSDKIRTKPPYLLDTTVIFPCAYSKEMKQEIIRIAKKAIKAIGITTGPVHMEMMMTKKGPIPVELAARGPGAKVFTEILPKVTGIDLLKASIQLSLGQASTLRRTKNSASVIKFFASDKTGTLKKISGLKKARKIKGVYELEFYVKKGDKIKALTCGDDRIGHVITFAKSRSEALKSADKVNKLIKIEV